MEIEIKEIVDGKMNGKYVYICDYRPSNGTKPIRHVKPQKVLVRCNSELNKNTRVYYSESHFIGLNKKGEPLKSKIIKPFDSTGYRSFTGTPVRVFDNMKECEAQYKEFDEAMNPKPVCCEYCKPNREFIHSDSDYCIAVEHNSKTGYYLDVEMHSLHGDVSIPMDFCIKCGRKLR